MSKFLNNEGLLYLWGKIKTYVTGVLPKKVSELENDSKFITLSDVPEGAAASNTVPKANGTPARARKPLLRAAITFTRTTTRRSIK